MSYYQIIIIITTIHTQQLQMEITIMVVDGVNVVIHLTDGILAQVIITVQVKAIGTMVSMQQLPMEITIMM